MKIDYKKLLNMFKDKYDEISHFNKHDYEIYKEYLYQFDKLIDDEIEFAKLAHKFEDSVNDAFSDRYCLALMFALEELGLLDAIESGRIEEKSLKESARKSIKEERYNVELSDYSGSIVDEETFDKKSDAIQWAKDNGRNCYARIWDNEEGKTVKEWKVKSIKENKMILSFEAFKDICVEEIGYSYIGSFDKHKGTYFVSVIDDKRADKFCKYLRDNYDCECTFWKITDPYDDDYGLYEIEVI